MLGTYIGGDDLAADAGPDIRAADQKLESLQSSAYGAASERRWLCQIMRFCATSRRFCTESPTSGKRMVDVVLLDPGRRKREVNRRMSAALEAAPAPTDGAAGQSGFDGKRRSTMLF